MKIKTSELEAAALDWVIAQLDEKSEDVKGYSPSTSWSQGGPLIESKRIAIVNATDRTPWLAMGMATKWMDGPTPLIAAMRALVASELGDEVDVPEELLT